MNIPRSKTWLMPGGSTREELIAFIKEQNETMLEYLDYASRLRAEIAELKKRVKE